MRSACLPDRATLRAPKAIMGMQDANMEERQFLQRLDQISHRQKSVRN